MDHIKLEPCTKVGRARKKGRNKKKLGLYSNLDVLWKRKKRRKSKTSWRSTSMALS